MVPLCMRAMISMSTRSSMCLPGHGNLPVSYLVLCKIFAQSHSDVDAVAHPILVGRMILLMLR